MTPQFDYNDQPEPANETEQDDYERQMDYEYELWVNKLESETEAHLDALEAEAADRA